jgi:hypothetical protein
LSSDWVEAVGTWIGGLGTVGTLIYAMLGLRREAAQRRAEIERLAAGQREAQHAQARTVVLHDADASLDGDGFDTPEFLTVTLKAGNYGTAPITGVVGKLKRHEPSSGATEPHTAFAFVIPAGELRTLSWHIPLAGLPDGFGGSANPLLHDVLVLFHAEVEFTDSYGARWAFRYGPGEQPRLRPSAPMVK